jgi:hypothetical protein
MRGKFHPPHFFCLFSFISVCHVSPLLLAVFPLLRILFLFNSPFTPSGKRSVFYRYNFTLFPIIIRRITGRKYRIATFLDDGGSDDLRIIISTPTFCMVPLPRNIKKINTEIFCDTFKKCCISCVTHLAYFC